jgi:hypothetical protein
MSLIFTRLIFLQFRTWVITPERLQPAGGITLKWRKSKNCMVFITSIIRYLGHLIGITISIRSLIPLSAILRYVFNNECACSNNDCSIMYQARNWFSHLIHERIYSWTGHHFLNLTHWCTGVMEKFPTFSKIIGLYFVVMTNIICLSDLRGEFFLNWSPFFRI